MAKVSRIIALAAILLLLGGVAISTSGSVADKIIDDFRKEAVPASPLLPPGLKVEAAFKPGAGPQIGVIEMVIGKAYVLHRDAQTAYAAAKGQPLFIGDTLVTEARSKILGRLDAKARFTVAAYTKITVDRSVYDEAAKTRDGRMSLTFGKARFVVEKLPAGSSGTFSVKTPTAIAGVRGSDFALMVGPGFDEAAAGTSAPSRVELGEKAYAAGLVTSIVTGGMTEVMFSGLTGPSQEVGSFSVSTAFEGGAAATPVVVGAAAAGGALDAVGSGFASMEMPASMER